MDGVIDLMSELNTINVLLINKLDNIVVEGDRKGLKEDREVGGDLEGGHPKISALSNI